MTVANHAIVRPGADGKICVFTFADAHVIVDLVGWLTAAGGYTGVVPIRAFDSRSTRALTADAPAVVSVAAVGVPRDAAVVLNVTAVDPGADGYLSVTPCPGSAGAASNVNYRAGQTVANLAATPVTADGTVCVRSFAPTHVLVDVMGWFAAGSSFRPVAPRRVLDTRTNGPAVAAGGTLSVDLGAVAPPPDATAAAITVTLTDAQADGYATAYPCGQPVPLASDVNYVSGQSVPAFTLAPLAGGHTCVFTAASANVVVDVAGWVGAGYTSLDPVRLVDTRSQQTNGA
jgi:hypothetical protein